MCLGNFIITPRNILVEATEENQRNTPLNTGYIRNITTNLSNMIFQAYNNSELHKGREFGSKGEHLASTLIYNAFQNLSLNPTKEKIETYPTDQINDKLEVLSRQVKINGNEVDSYISPRWNDSFLYRDSSEQLSPEFDTSQLNTNYSYSGLHILQRPQFSSLKIFFIEILIDLWREWTENISGHNEFTFIGYLISRYQEDQNFFFSNLTQEQARETFPWFNNLLDNVTGNYVLFDEDPWNNPEAADDLTPHSLFLNYFPPLSYPMFAYPLYSLLFQLMVMRTNSSCKGVILYDFNNDTHDMNPLLDFPLPVIFINKSDGLTIKNAMNTTTVDFYINQTYNDSVESYNVIGQINGSDPSKTIIISSLYDSWWNQGTADSGIGVGILLALAEYYKELETHYGIIPKYTLKFIAFGGEEHGYLGAYHYEASHPDENIVSVIDLNQLGFTQTDPQLTFDICTNKILYAIPLFRIAEKAHYVERTGYNTDLAVYWLPQGGPSNDKPFAENRNPGFPLAHPVTVSFFKDRAWLLHHRDGLNHTEGDVMKYYNETDVAISSDLIFNITRYFCLNPNCRYTPNSVTYKPFDGPDEDSVNNDSVNINFTITTQLPQDCATIRALLINYMCPILYCYLNTSDYAVTPTGITADFNVTLPRWAPPGWYWLKVYLLNSTEEVGFKYHHMSNVYSAQILNNT